MADPSHRKRVFARAIYNLANAPVSINRVSKGLGAHLIYCYGACVKQNRHLSAEELSVKVYNVLDHVCGDHEKCEETWCYDKKAQRCNITYTPPGDHRINKDHDPRSYEQLKKIFDQYANIKQMAYCNHPFDTQTNEALTQAIANVAPKSVCYSSTISLYSRIALIIGVHNLGRVVFSTQLFDELGVDPGDELMNFLQLKEKNKERKKNYQ